MLTSLSTLKTRVSGTGARARTSVIQGHSDWVPLEPNPESSRLDRRENFFDEAAKPASVAPVAPIGEFAVLDMGAPDESAPLGSRIRIGPTPATTATAA